MFAQSGGFQVRAAHPTGVRSVAAGTMIEATARGRVAAKAAPTGSRPEVHG